MDPRVEIANVHPSILSSGLLLLLMMTTLLMVSRNEKSIFIHSTGPLKVFEFLPGAYWDRPELMFDGP